MPAVMCRDVRCPHVRERGEAERHTLIATSSKPDRLSIRQRHHAAGGLRDTRRAGRPRAGPQTDQSPSRGAGAVGTAADGASRLLANADGAALHAIGALDPAAHGEALAHLIGPGAAGGGNGAADDEADGQGADAEGGVARAGLGRGRHGKRQGGGGDGGESERLEAVHGGGPFGVAGASPAPMSRP
ncbi:MAG: hypothetical protein DWQ56_11095 [Microcystis aeruginosa DA14]|uniref:Uncharacterized protein n=1 Tax=Microcystis aeruginosa DA14 TaxID=1987506 RepID=A0A3E0MDQ2_MICAE|nr:MAG: hypothetical protein DWQ56_11095 [Microcystis aeruginosa DA14]